MLEFHKVQIMEDGDHTITLRNVKIYNNDIFELGHESFVRIEYDEHVFDRVAQRNRGRYARCAPNTVLERTVETVSECGANLAHRVRYVNTEYILSCE